jgi:hypothetical protein
MLFLYGGYMMYTSEAAITYMSVEVGVFIVGLYLFLASDTGIFGKKENKCDDK